MDNERIAVMADENPMQQLPGLLGWVLAACVTIGLALVGAIKLMYSKIEAMYAVQLLEQAKQIGKVEERCRVMEEHYEECNEDREQLRIQTAELRIQGAESRTRIELMERDMAKGKQ